MVLEQTYYAVYLDHITENWGGSTYHAILVKEYPNENLESTASTQTTTMDFLYPELIRNTYFLDGRAYGHFTLYNSHESDASTVSAYTVTLLKTADAPNATVTLGTYSNTITTKNNIVAKGYLVLPISINLSHENAEINADEKLILRISITQYSNGTINISHANIASDEDIKITLPIVYGNMGH